MQNQLSFLFLSSSAALSSRQQPFPPATALSSSNRPFLQQPPFPPATALSSSNTPFLQQQPFPYNYPLLFVIPTGATCPAAVEAEGRDLRCAIRVPRSYRSKTSTNIHRILTETPTSLCHPDEQQTMGAPHLARFSRDVGYHGPRTATLSVCSSRLPRHAVGGADLPTPSQERNEHGRAVFAIQARRAETKRQPSPEGLGNRMRSRSSAGGAAPHSSFLQEGIHPSANPSWKCFLTNCQPHQRTPQPRTTPFPYCYMLSRGESKTTPPTKREQSS